MRRNTLAEIAGRAILSIARATINKANDGPMMQELSADFQNKDNRKKVERLQNYGFTSMPKSRDEKQQSKASDPDIEQKKGPAAEALALFVGGERSHPVILGVDDRRYRPRYMEEGESAQYDDQMQVVYLKRDGAYIASPLKASLRHVKKDKQPAGEAGKDYKHEGEDGKVTAEIKVTEGNIRFYINGVCMGEIDDRGFVVGGKFDDQPPPKQMHRKTDLDDAGNKAVTHAKRGWGW